MEPAGRADSAPLAVAAHHRPKERGIGAKWLGLRLFMGGKPLTALTLARAAMALGPRPDIGLPAVQIDGIQMIDAGNLHHIVHENGLMKVSKLRFGILHDHPPAPLGHADAHLARR